MKIIEVMACILCFAIAVIIATWRFQPISLYGRIKDLESRVEALESE